MLLARRLVEAGVPFVTVFWKGDKELDKLCKMRDSKRTESLHEHRKATPSRGTRLRLQMPNSPSRRNAVNDVPSSFSVT